MQRDAERLSHIVDSVASILGYVQGVSFDTLTTDQKLQDAVLYRLTVLGEAANKISKASQLRFAEIPWRQMADFRNVVVHEYHRIDWFIVWDVATKHLPQIQVRLEQIFAELNAEDQV